jgi:predicted nucleic acid-binding protein
MLVGFLPVIASSAAMHMTTSDVFFDTNVVVYAMAGDPPSAARSWEVMRAGGTVSIQVLNECANTLRRKFSFDWPDIAEACGQIRELCDIVALTEAAHIQGLALAERHQLSVYDGMIVAAAQLAGCRTLYSEDMHDGLVIDRLTIRNPYAPPGA